jgi:hypothetical protein
MRSSKADRLNMKVMDLSGKIIDKQNLTPNNTVNIGSTYRPGVYLVEVIQGTERIVLKLIKL